MQQYSDLVRHVLDNGHDKSDRTGVGTRATFGYQMRFDLAEGFPCVTTKDVRIGSVIRELQGVLKGDPNGRWLQKKNVT